MLAEIARKREVLERARAEAAQRELECCAAGRVPEPEELVRSHTQSAQETHEAQELPTRSAQR
jgi:hypothetical protein